MRELTLNEIEEVNGGAVPVVIIGYLAARYAAKYAAQIAAQTAEKAALAYIAWQSKELGRYGS